MTEDRLRQAVRDLVFKFDSEWDKPSEVADEIIALVRSVAPPPVDQGQHDNRSGEQDRE